MDVLEADYRIIGLVELAVAMQQGRPQRFIELTTRCERPEPVPLGADESVFA